MVRTTRLWKAYAEGGIGYCEAIKDRLTSLTHWHKCAFAIGCCQWGCSYYERRSGKHKRIASACSMVTMLWHWLEIKRSYGAKAGAVRKAIRKRYRTEDDVDDAYDVYWAIDYALRCIREKDDGGCIDAAGQVVELARQMALRIDHCLNEREIPFNPGVRESLAVQVKLLGYLTSVEELGPEEIEKLKHISRGRKR